MYSEMFVSVSQQLDDRIHFFLTSTVSTAKLNTAAVLEAVLHRLSVGIPQITAGGNVISSVIDKEDNRELKQNHPVRCYLRNVGIVRVFK